MLFKWGVCNPAFWESRQHFMSVFYLNNNTSLLLSSPSDTLFSLLWLNVLVSSGAITCVYGSPHQYWCQHASVPSVQNQALKANVLIHKVERTMLFGLMDVTYRTFKKLSHFICVSCFLNGCSLGDGIYISNFCFISITLNMFCLIYFYCNSCAKTGVKANRILFLFFLPF